MKLTDDISDKILFHNLLSIPFGLAYGLLIGYLMHLDPDASLLFGGIVLGCLITGKINSSGHYFGLGAILVMLFLNGIKLPIMVLLIAALAALDELGEIKLFPRSLIFVFDYRLVLKIGILMLVILNLLDLIAFIILLVFDAAYMLTERIILRLSNEI